MPQCPQRLLFLKSPSMRREWIEISLDPPSIPHIGVSPSMRREWIEISETLLCATSGGSPSMRREWIEMICYTGAMQTRWVSLHAEGVD